MRNKQYCILNKQYSREEYEALVPRIIAHMDSNPYTDRKGRVHRYGEYFPLEICPFAYNEAMAQEYFGLSKEQIEQNGFLWRDAIDRKYVPTKRAADLPQSSGEITDALLSEVIECAHKGECHDQCTMVYRFIPGELQSYRTLSIPLPRLCPNCRHYARLRQRTPIKLWHRGCQCAGPASQNGLYNNTVSHDHGNAQCPNEFETSYPPDHPEIVYCEKCYQAEVV